MNKDLQTILDLSQQSEHLTEEEKSIIAKALKAVDNELVITTFKLDRTEKVKRTTAILLEETIEELEKKRADVEEANKALKASLEELKAAQAKLIHSEKMASLGELTAGIAHEIQNPLNFVNNFSEVSADLVEEMNEEIALNNHAEVKQIADDLKANLEKISHHGKRASSIVKGMLEHSRSGDSQMELTDINVLADEYVRLAYHGLRAKDKSFQADFSVNLDYSLPKINVIPQEIGRVLLNLINNAFYAVNKKANSSGDSAYKPLVSISTRMQSPLEGLPAAKAGGHGGVFKLSKTTVKGSRNKSGIRSSSPSSPPSRQGRGLDLA